MFSKWCFSFFLDFGSFGTPSLLVVFFFSIFADLTSGLLLTCSLKETLDGSLGYMISCVVHAAAPIGGRSSG